MQRQSGNASFNEVQRYIQDCSYPCSKEELISCARDHQAPTEVIRTLEVISPETEIYDPSVVKESIGKVSQ